MAATIKPIKKRSFFPGRQGQQKLTGNQQKAAISRKKLTIFPTKTEFALLPFHAPNP
jgi:hypothetical protein